MRFVGKVKEYLQDIVNLDEDENLSPEQLRYYFHQPCIDEAELLLGVNRGRRQKNCRETWWWTDDTRKSVARKSNAFKAWTTYGGDDADQRKALQAKYKRCNKEA